MTDSIKSDLNDSNTIGGTILQKIMSEFFFGDWHKFFKVWNSSFLSDVTKLKEYKILTFKLRVHFAILPIRIIQLHQYNNCELHKFSKAHIILKNFAENFNLVNNENEDFEEEENKLTLDCMKQLENFFNSEDGQKLANELKDSSLRIFFALPYISIPHEDESIKKIFTINWLTELTEDLEKFIILFSKNLSSNLEHKHVNNDCNKTENKRNSSSRRSIHSAVKNKQVEDWIANHQHVNENGHVATKSTQTQLNDVGHYGDLRLTQEINNINTILRKDSINSSNQCSHELLLTKSRLFSVHKHYKKLKWRFHQLHEDYQKMNEIAEVLTQALENSVRGQPVNMEKIIQSCIKIFPDRFDRDIQTDSEDTSLDLKESSENTLDSRKNVETVNNTATILVSPETLDYTKIKNHLKSKDTRAKLLLLQALRQKLTLNEVDHRNKTIFEYSKNDLLELLEFENNTDSSENVLLSLLQNVNLENSINFTQQTTSRFLNAIASFNVGRTYLTSGPAVLNMIINYLNNCNDGAADSVTLDMLTATLQKMSLRKQQREYMIEANLVEWLMHHLNNEKSEMGVYRLEYICALLMNLSLHNEARTRASKMAPFLMSIMTSLITMSSSSVLPYVNGALQNFLLNNEINNEAKKINFTKILEYHYIKCNQELRPHFLQTLKIHKRECNENLSDDEFPDEDNDTFDVLEKELEQGDPIEVKSGEFQGENLLAKQYCISNFSLDSKEFFFKRTSEPTGTRNYNSICRESKKTALNGSMINTASETTLDDFKTETTEKKSGTRRLAKSRNFSILNKGEEKSAHRKNEDPFLAKPKLMRTPPSSARMVFSQENKFKRIRNKVK